MHVRRFDNLSELEPYRDAWDALAAGNVFRSWTWLSTWWRHYGVLGGERSLNVQLAFADASESPETLRAILPVYIESTWTQGRVLRLLGDGEICSDHLGLLAAPADGNDAAAAIVDAMIHGEEWDLLDLAAIDAHDAATFQLLDEFAANGFTTSRQPADCCWVIDLPATWEEFLALQSKSHRKQLRQLERRVLDSGRASWHTVTSIDEFGNAWSTLVDLHQSRRQQLGEPGCFASATWSAFHWEVAQRLLARGWLRLSTLQLDGLLLAAEYHLAGLDTTWAYQGGLDPSRLAEEPGQLSTLASIQRAIKDRHAHFDFLRGDEPYKAHWRATPRQTYRLAAVPNRLWPRVRQSAWSGARRVRGAAKQLTNLFS